MRRMNPCKATIFLSLGRETREVSLPKIFQEMDYIRQGVLFEVAPKLDEFSITWASDNGHWVHIDRAVCTSFHSEGDTMNIKNLTTGETATVILDTIKEFAGKEVLL